MFRAPNLSPYVQFKINAPKERVISVVPFCDRVIHHAIINVLEPVFERQLIYHTYACRVRKGTHAAARYALRCAKSAQCFLKLDVRKYFDSIDHSILKRQLCRIIKDARCLELLFSVVDSYSSCVAVADKGLPIGNLTSQFFANLYLSPLDHFVLETLKPRGCVRFYVRYMDDMLFFADSMTELKALFMAVKHYCAEKLLLSLKEPSFGFVRHGVPFLGWRIQSKNVSVLGKTRHRMKQKLELIASELDSGLISEEKAIERSQSVFAARKLMSL